MWREQILGQAGQKNYDPFFNEQLVYKKKKKKNPVKVKQLPEPAQIRMGPFCISVLEWKKQHL